MILSSGKGDSIKRQNEGTVIHAALLPSPSETRRICLVMMDHYLVSCVFYLFHFIFIGSNFSTDVNGPY